MVVPDGQDGKHGSRKMAMHCDEGTKNAMPVLHSTARSDCFIPGAKQGSCLHLPRRGKSGGELISLWSQDGSALPRPADQMHSNLSKVIDGPLLNDIEVLTKAQQTRKRELHMA